jgi:SAM-dependent methyltransferase
VSGDDATTGRAYLEQQYATDGNLAARQAIYRYAQSSSTLPARCFTLAGLGGAERILDVGCGNGQYLAVLEERGYHGLCVGADRSLGMLHAARARVTRPPLALMDAQDMPFASNAFDAVLAMHMLYHVPDRAQSITEMRRVLRPGGVALVSTNSDDHLRELEDIVRNVVGAPLGASRLNFTLESGEPELRATFDRVERHDLFGELVITEVEPVVDYVSSVKVFLGDGDITPRVEAIRSQVARVIEEQGAFRVRTAAGMFVCS